jgi:predicted RNA-binding Zn-ribbon protein involved in translation (DUF1610 family)
MENSVVAHNCPNCGGTVRPKEEKCGWCYSFVSIKESKHDFNIPFTGDMDPLYYIPVQCRNPLKSAEFIYSY